MAQRTLAIKLDLPWEPEPDVAVERILAPLIARLDRQDCEVIQLPHLNNMQRYSIHAIVAGHWPDVVHESVGMGSSRVLRLFTRRACKTVLLHPSSPLAALPQALQQAITTQAMAPMPAPQPVPRAA